MDPLQHESIYPMRISYQAAQICFTKLTSRGETSASSNSLSLGTPSATAGAARLQLAAA